MARFDPTNPAAGPMLASDTARSAQRLQVELWRRMTPLEKARVVSDTSRAVQELSLVGIRRRYPGASERECTLRLAALILGRSLASEVYPELSSLSGR